MLTAQQTEKLVRHIKIRCREEYEISGYIKDDRPDIKTLTESF